MGKLQAPRKQEKYKQMPLNYECKPARGFCFSLREYSKNLRANNVIIVYLERLAFVSVKENIRRANNVIIVYLER